MGKEFLLARQPIVTPDLNPIGFEMLYRPQGELNTSISGDMATAHVLSTILCDAFKHELLDDTSFLFVNMTREALMNIHLLSLPADYITYEILEDVHVDSILQKRLVELKAKGYRFALDDFTLASSHKHLLDLAEIVKLDVRVLNQAELMDHVAYLRNYPVQLLAEKVETREEFEFCKSLGFDLYQGYFHAKPQLIAGKALSMNRTAVFRLLNRLNDPEITDLELVHLISMDPVLAYRLLRYAGACQTTGNLNLVNLQELILALGNRRLHTIISMFSMCEMATRSDALVQTALRTAHACRIAAQNCGSDRAEAFYLAGMLSTFDTFLARPLSEILAPLPIQSELADAILHFQGDLGNVLRCVIQNNPNTTCSECNNQLTISELIADADLIASSIFQDITDMLTDTGV